MYCTGQAADKAAVSDRCDLLIWGRFRAPKLPLQRHNIHMSFFADDRLQYRMKAEGFRCHKC